MANRGLLDSVLLLAACKCEDNLVRVVSQEAGRDLALEYGASYFETSALQNDGIEELFDAATRYDSFNYLLLHSLRNTVVT